MLSMGSAFSIMVGHISRCGASSKEDEPELPQRCQLSVEESHCTWVSSSQEFSGCHWTTLVVSVVDVVSLRYRISQDLVALWMILSWWGGGGCCVCLFFRTLCWLSIFLFNNYFQFPASVLRESFAHHKLLSTFVALNMCWLTPLPTFAQRAVCSSDVHSASSPARFDVSDPHLSPSC